MRRNRGRVDRQASTLGVYLERIDGAQMLDDAGEHEYLASLCSAQKVTARDHEVNQQDTAKRDGSP